MNKYPLQIACITGRSQLPGQAKLSQLPWAFISLLAGSERQRVRLNVPYSSPTGSTAGEASPGRLSARFNHSRDSLASRRSGFQKKYHDAVATQLSPARYTILLAGRCGRARFNHLNVSAEVMKHTRLIACGAVAQKCSQCQPVLTQGYRDGLPRVWLRHADCHVPYGYMTSLSRPEMLAICQRFITQTASQDASR